MSELDTFLVGDGSARLMQGYLEEESYSRQIVAKDDLGVALEIRDDTDQFVDESLGIELSTRDEIEWAFHEYKKVVYDVYGYVELKSSWLQGVPVKLEDLVMDDADKYLIDYLVNDVKDLYVWKQLAKLQACMNMGVSHVRFTTQHDCPLCKAANGQIMLAENLLRLLCRGAHVTHRCCPCDVTPVVYRERYEGALEGRLDTEVVTWGTRDLLHVPRELLANDELKTLVESLPWLEIDFVNMPTWCEQNNVDNPQGLVVYPEEETLYVHNSYVGNSSPVDYLRVFLESEAVPDRLSPEDKLEAQTYWMDGQQVLKHEGHYYDAVSCERLK